VFLFIFIFLFLFLLRPDRERQQLKRAIFLAISIYTDVGFERSDGGLGSSRAFTMKRRINAIIAFALLRQTLGLGELRLLK